MGVENIADRIADILPDRDPGVEARGTDVRSEEIRNAADGVARRYTARELAQMKSREKAELRKLKARERAAAEKAEAGEAAGILPGRTAFQQRAIDDQEALVASVEALEEKNSGGADALIRSGLSVRQAAALRTTTRRDVAKLLANLNINLDMRLTKKDTSDLLACLLTCNETQLNAVYNNRKVPVAVKTVIKRLLDDMRTGNTETVNSLWDRLFGRAGMSEPSGGGAEIPGGIIPGTPLSREAYVVLRETLIK